MTAQAYNLTLEQWDCLNHLAEILASSKSLSTIGKYFTPEQVENSATPDYFNAVCHLLDMASKTCQEAQKLLTQPSV